MSFVRTPMQFYIMRFTLGIAEAGFFPGVIYYLSHWFPGSHRARAIAKFTIAILLSQVLSGGIGGALLDLSGLGLSGWQWLFLVEGLPSIALGLLAARYLCERPADAAWLRNDERAWLVHHLNAERLARSDTASHAPLKSLGNPLLWLLAIAYFTYYSTGLGFIVWSPLLTRSALGTSDSATALLVGTIAACSAAVYLLAGAWADRQGDHCGIAAAGLTFCVLGYSVAGTASNPLLIVGGLVTTTMGCALFLPPFWCLLTRLPGSQSGAAGIALVSAIGASGGFFGPAIIGLAKRTSGGEAGAFYTLAVLAAVGRRICLVLRRRPAFEIFVSSGIEA